MRRAFSEVTQQIGAERCTAVMLLGFGWMFDGIPEDVVGILFPHYSKVLLAVPYYPV